MLSRNTSRSGFDLSSLEDESADCFAIESAAPALQARSSAGCGGPMAPREVGAVRTQAFGKMRSTHGDANSRHTAGDASRVGRPAFVFYWAGHPARLASWWTPKRAASSRRRARGVAAKNRPRRSSPLVGTRRCLVQQLSADELIRSRIPDRSAERTASPWRKSLPVNSTRSRAFPSEKPSSISSRDESSLRGSSSGRSRVNS